MCVCGCGCVWTVLPKSSPVHNFVIPWWILKKNGEMLTIMRRCVAGKTQVRSFEKVTLRSQTLKVGIYFSCPVCNCQSWMDYKNYLVEMLKIIKRCVARKTQVHSTKFKVKKWGLFLCSVHNVVIPWWILKLLCSNVYHHATMDLFQIRSEALSARKQLAVIDEE